MTGGVKVVGEALERHDKRHKTTVLLWQLVRVLIFFFVQALGITTALEVTFSHFRLRTSCMHAAVKRHVDRTARTSWLSSSMILSRLQASRTSDCPHRQDLGIAFMDCYDLLPLICISGNNSSQKTTTPSQKKRRRYLLCTVWRSSISRSLCEYDV